MAGSEFCCEHTVVHEEAVRDAKRQMQTDETYSRAADFFKLLGDLTRVKIIGALDCRELCVCDISNILGMTKSAVSHQLALLRKAGFVTFRRDGKQSIIPSQTNISGKYWKPASFTFRNREREKTMDREQKKAFAGIIAAAVLLGISFIPAVTGTAEIILCITAYLIVGGSVLEEAVKNIFHGEVFDENFLMSVATIGAIAIGQYPEAVAVMLFYQIGELFQDIAVEKSRASITSLMDIRPDYANIEENGQLKQVAPDSVAAGSVIVIKPGEKIPLDGVVIDGESSLNTTALTGESLPRDVATGDSVISGCVNMSGLLHVRTTGTFGESTVSKILELVEKSDNGKANTEKFITRFAKIYTPAVVIGAALLAVIPSLVTGQWTTWIQRALIFLVISCPCALVISIPLGFFGGIGGASRIGVLIKGSNYLEALAKTEIVVFDKTGTLTKGNFSVSAIHPEIISKDELLEIAALAESYSDHPISLSLRAAYKRARWTNPVIQGRRGDHRTRDQGGRRRQDRLRRQQQTDGSGRR
jgi:cation transport ATPase